MAELAIKAQTQTAADRSKTTPEIANETEFDEVFYLKRYPDVADAVRTGRFRSGWHHYEVAGRRERREVRFCGEFDETFYLRSYPLASEEIAARLARDAVDHFRRWGKYRGYLPTPTAERPDNPSAAVSRFGGLWTDLPNALDITFGKLEIGQISEKQAALLRFWISHGYVILENALPDHIVDAAGEALERAYSGQLPDQLFECGAATGSRTAIKWREEVNDHPAKALDIHFLSRAIREAIFADPISDFLALLFESRALASQTLGFWRGSAQQGHQDTAYVNYSKSRDFVASWIALEDVTVGAGELFYYVGSHALSDFLYAGRWKTIYDCRRMTDGAFPAAEVQRFIDSLKARTAQYGMEKKPFAAKKGDVLIWHADLVHGGNPVSKDITRKSVVAHYCPSRLVPLYFENRPVKIYQHGLHRYASGVYLHAQPSD